jgi:trehalose synthase
MSRLRSLHEVETGIAPIAHFRALIDAEESSELESTLHALANAMQGRRLWNVNSTARGGGVAEMLGALIPYGRGAGIDERWVVIEGSPAFFAVTKKLHTLLHGVRPDGSDLSDAERREYERALAPNAEKLLEEVRPGDVAILHDPQTAGLAPTLREHGVRVVWRSHIGVDEPNAIVREAWSFLRPFVAGADALIFSRQAHVWEGLERARVAIIPPCIDPFAPKNRDMDGDEVDSILEQAALPNATRMVLQVSRWDRLKDPAGVLRGFADHIAGRVEACLVLAGPAVTSVDDDPEEPKVIEEVTSRWRSLPAPVRDRIVIAQLPMEDVERNALMVNALQRKAAVVVQKSLAEGFGLTVAEAMWKGKPVVASRVGGIEDQIEDGRSGILVDDPADLREFGEAVVGLLGDPARARGLGRAAKRRVASLFIPPRHLVAQGNLITAVVDQ